jgi:phosphoribosylamine--glycine ligase/phosphoribosylformylglycinamidine cyclo-ligase
MNVLLIGSGGREDAIAFALSKSNSVEQIFIAPGNGSLRPKCTNIKTPVTAPFTELIKFAISNDISLVIPGPEQPLVDGIANAFKKVGIPCFGPSQDAARLEGSKAYSKQFMVDNKIPTAEFKVFTDITSAKTYISQLNHKYVIKASGLAAGKGVFLPDSINEAYENLKELMEDNSFGSAGKEIVIEERLEGEEVSILCFCDGYTIIQLPPAQDHKRIFDGDLGGNTGGMGCYAPAPIYSNELKQIVQETILKKTVDAMRQNGIPFVGCLYAGLMLTKQGPKLLEYNVRFGDPETQVVLPLLDDKCDFGKILLAASTGCLDSAEIKYKNSFACTVVGASKGYPGAYQKGRVITIPIFENDIVFQAGTAVNDKGELVTNGGRVLTCTSVRDSLPGAIEASREAISRVKFEGIHYRTDIGYRALEFLKNQA